MKRKVAPEREEEQVNGRQIADHFQVDVHTVRRWRYDGCPCVVYNPVMIRYRLSEVEQWLRNRKVTLPNPPKRRMIEADV
jgi:phage terminase Nu1 subunit (DNA packaging protein)